MDKIKVLVKIRPRTKEEWKLNLKEHSSIPTMVESFNFEHIFGPTSNNADIYKQIAPMVERCKMGFNSTIICYGQKSSGKTHTMMGNDMDAGIAVRAIHQLFEENQPPHNRLFILRVGFIEIFNESVYDLLNRRQSIPFSRRTLSNKEVVVNDKKTVLKLLDRGNKAKSPSSMVDAPYSSHTIFQIIIENQEQALEITPVKISCINLVDLDRSEGAQVKNEKGDCFDKSLEYLELAVKALSKGEHFQYHDKSKLTRLLKLGDNSNTAIVCHITPTSPNQSNITLNFANDARNVKTKAYCNKVYSDDAMIKWVRADIARLQRLKDELEPQMSNSSKIDCEIADLNSILLLGRGMRPQGQMNPVESKQILRIRPFFQGFVTVGMQKKYQIGEMMDKSVDAQSRSQRKSTAFKQSDFYLERVGFELNMRMKRHLKYGTNIIGRSTVDSDVDVDICVDSPECSRKHCCIHISNNSNDSVTIRDLNSSNGTTINGITYKNKTIELHEGDVISIVGGRQRLVGNFDCTVYRLCRFTTEKMKHFDLDDDPIVIINDDDDDDNNNDTAYCPLKMELELPEPMQFVEIETEKPMTTLPPKISKQANPTVIDDGDDPLKLSEIDQSSTLLNRADPIIVIDDDDGNDTSYYPVKMELELPEPSSFAEIGTDQSSTMLNPADPMIEIEEDRDISTLIDPVKTAMQLPDLLKLTEIEQSTSVLNQADPIIVIDDDDGNDTSYYPVKMELEPTEPSTFVENGIEQWKTTSTPITPSSTTPTSKTSTTPSAATPFSTTSESLTLSQNHDGEFNLNSFIFDDDTFVDLNDIMTMPIIQDENMSRIQNENLQLVQQLQDYENEKKLQAEQIADLQVKLMAAEQEKNMLYHENAKIAANLKEIEKDRDALREKSIKHIGEILEHFYDGKTSKID